MTGRCGSTERKYPPSYVARNQRPKPGDRHDRPVIDTVILDYAQRSAQKAAIVGVKGGKFEVDLHHPVRLRTDDLLLLDDGGLIEVVAAPEPLVEARAPDVATLARLAWHLGDRHVPVQLLGSIASARDAMTRSRPLLSALGAKIALIEAPFNRKAAPMRRRAHGHQHHHAHAHDH